MMKFLLFALCIIGIYMLFFKKSKTPKTKSQESLMLECAKCGTYVSSDEAILQNGKSYCSKECAKC